MARPDDSRGETKRVLSYASPQRAELEQDDDAEESFWFRPFSREACVMLAVFAGFVFLVLLLLSRAFDVPD